MTITTTEPTYDERTQWRYTPQQLKAITEFVATCELCEREQGFTVNPENTLRKTLEAILINNAAKEEC